MAYNRARSKELNSKNEPYLCQMTIYCFTYEIINRISEGKLNIYLSPS